MAEIREICPNSCNSSECNPFKSVKFYFQDKEGIIDVLQILNDNGATSNYFISGPPVMIKSFKKVLFDHGVTAQNVLTDDWE